MCQEKNRLRTEFCGISKRSSCMKQKEKKEPDGQSWNDQRSKDRMRTGWNPGS